MGDRKRDKGKQKKTDYDEGFGDSSEESVRRTRVRTTESPGEQNGAGGNPFLPWPQVNLQDDGSRNSSNRPGPQQRPAAQGGGEEGGRGGLQTRDLISQMDRLPRVVLSRTQVAGSAAQHRESGGVGNPDRCRRCPQPRTLTPPPSQRNFGRYSTGQQLYATSLVQPAATLAPQPRAQAPSSSQAQRSRSQQRDIGPSFTGTNASDYLPLGLSMPSSDAQRGETSSAGARGRGLQVQVRAPATAGQPGAASGALGSGQPRSWFVPYLIVRCPACYNNPRGDQCLLCGREPASVNLAIDPHQRQPPPQQGLPAPPTNHTALAALPQFSGNTFGPSKPRAPALEGQAQSSVTAGRHDFPHVPLHQRCPSCRIRPGKLVALPQQHFCMCKVCRQQLLACPSCVSLFQQQQPPCKGKN